MSAKSFYIAGRYSRMTEFQIYRKQLIDRGYTCRARWLDGRHDYEHLDIAATEDFEDINYNEGIVVFLEPLDVEIPHANNTGGRLWEGGIAHGLGKEVHVIGNPHGPREVVFTYLPEIHVHSTWGAFLKSLNKRNPPIPDMNTTVYYRFSKEEQFQPDSYSDGDWC